VAVGVVLDDVLLDSGRLLAGNLLHAKRNSVLADIVLHVGERELAELFEHLPLAHHCALRSLLGELGDPRRELNIFQQSRERALGNALRDLGVDGSVRAPADFLRIGEIGECDGFVLGIGQDCHRNPLPEWSRKASAICT
jgi:hypothetical protein